jgi:hypothetical protein
MSITTIKKQVKNALNGLEIPLKNTDFEDYKTRLDLFREFILLPEGDDIDPGYKNHINTLLNELQGHARNLINYTMKNDEQNMKDTRSMYDNVSDTLKKVINENEYELESDVTKLDKIKEKRSNLIPKLIASLDFPPRKSNTSVSVSDETRTPETRTPETRTPETRTSSPLGWKVSDTSRFLVNPPTTETKVPIYSKNKAKGKNITKKYKNKKKKKQKARARTRARK